MRLFPVIAPDSGQLRFGGVRLPITFYLIDRAQMTATLVCWLAFITAMKTGWGSPLFDDRRVNLAWLQGLECYVQVSIALSISLTLLAWALFSRKTLHIAVLGASTLAPLYLMTSFGSA